VNSAAWILKALKAHEMQKLFPKGRRGGDGAVGKTHAFGVRDTVRHQFVPEQDT